MKKALAVLAAVVVVACVATGVLIWRLTRRRFARREAAAFRYAPARAA